MIVHYNFLRSTRDIVYVLRSELTEHYQVELNKRVLKKAAALKIGNFIVPYKST